MADEEKVREMQQKYIELQLIEQQLKQFQKQIQNIDLQIVELNNTKANIEELKDVKPGSEVLIPISPGIFFDGAVKNSSEFKVNIGADIVVVKSASETKKLVDEQISELNKLREEMIRNLQELVLQAQAVEKDLEKLSD